MFSELTSLNLFCNDSRTLVKKRRCLFRNLWLSIVHLCWTRSFILCIWLQQRVAIENPFDPSLNLHASPIAVSCDISSRQILVGANYSYCLSLQWKYANQISLINRDHRMVSEIVGDISRSILRCDIFRSSAIYNIVYRRPFIITNARVLVQYS